MPPLPTVPNVLRADLQYNDGSDLSVAARHFFRYSGAPPTSADALTLAADIYGAMASHAGLWDTFSSLAGCKVTDLSSSTGGVGEHAQVTIGTRPNTPLPGGTAVVVNYVIARRYRGGKPRNYMPWFVADDLQPRQLWFAEAVNDATTALAAFFPAVIGLVSGGTTITAHVNVSYYSGFTAVQNPITGRWRNVPKLRTTPLVDDILSWSVSSRPGSQRRRN